MCLDHDVFAVTFDLSFFLRPFFATQGETIDDLCESEYADDLDHLRKLNEVQLYQRVHDFFFPSSPLTPSPPSLVSSLLHSNSLPATVAMA